MFIDIVPHLLGMAFAPSAYIVAKKLCSIKPVSYDKDYTDKISQMFELSGVNASNLAKRIFVRTYPISLIVLRFMRAKRISRAKEQMPTALSLMLNALKAGMALPHAMDIAASELSPPLGNELNRVKENLHLGTGIDEALSSMLIRIPSDDMELMVNSIQILRRTGGNLIETISLLLSTIEDRNRTMERIKTSTAEARLQCAFLAALPWLLCAALYSISPTYIEPLFNTKLGILVLFLAIFMEVLGGIWMWKISEVKV